MFCQEHFTLGPGAHRFLAIPQWFVHLATHPQQCAREQPETFLEEGTSVQGWGNAEWPKPPAPVAQVNAVRLEMLTQTS